ncbi:MAG: aminotransferase class I/II-fold pyridoxal phosphate-dependent enzyme [Alphaproteobacteria bacterium]|nr:aminotransferase class I/II-fold pyridoxal phosphate-dependent enzyme [Alphaproteobacteria bacterium]
MSVDAAVPFEDSFLSPNRFTRPSGDLFLNDAIMAMPGSATIKIGNLYKALPPEEQKDACDLSLGQLNGTDFPTPKHVIDAMISALKNNMTGYTPAGGTKEFRAAVAHKFRRDNKLHYEQDEVMGGAGGKQILFNAFAVTLNDGDSVIMGVPGWVTYKPVVEYFGGKMIEVETEWDNDYKMTAAQLREALQTAKDNDQVVKWVILNSPSNPTGALYTKQELREIATVMKDFPDTGILSDNVYEYLILNEEDKFCDIAQVVCDPEDPIELKNPILIASASSKSDAMTGLRTGYGAGPAWLIAAMIKFSEQSTNNPNSVAQEGARAALEEDRDRSDWIKTLRDHRDAAQKILGNKLGRPPKSKPNAFYIFQGVENAIGKIRPDTNTVIETADDFAMYVWETQRVAVTPNEGFGGKDPAIRISYAARKDKLETGCHRLCAAFDKLKPAPDAELKTGSKGVEHASTAMNIDPQKRPSDKKTSLREAFKGVMKSATRRLARLRPAYLNFREKTQSSLSL